MKPVTLEKLADDYLENVLTFAQCQYKSNFKSSNQYAKKILKIGEQLRLIGSEGEEKLTRLMFHPDVYVRIWAASDSFPFSHEQAEKVLEDIITSSEGLVAMTAKITLSELKNIPYIVYPNQ